MVPFHCIPALAEWYLPSPSSLLVMRGGHLLTGLVPVLIWALLAYTTIAQQDVFEHHKIIKNFEAQSAKIEARDAQGGYDVPTDSGSPPPEYSPPPPYYPPPPEPTESS